MKYFTPEWHGGDLSGEEVNSRRDAYWAEVEAIRASMPDEVSRLVSTNLHDGLIRSVVLDHSKETLSLDLRCGDLQVGYFDASIHYLSPVFRLGEFGLLASLARDANTELLYTEIGLDPVGYVHRHLFWPYAEIDVRFSEVRLRTCAARGREFQRLSDPVREIGQSAI